MKIHYYRIKLLKKGMVEVKKCLLGNLSCSDIFIDGFFCDELRN